MSRRLTIRARLAALYALLAAALLVATMAAVYLIEQRDVARRLEIDARGTAAAALARLGDADEDTLAAIGPGDALVLIRREDGSIVVSEPAARVLASVATRPAGSRRIVIGTESYEVASITGGNGSTAVAAIPAARASAELSSLLDRMLQIGAIGLVVTTALAWLVARAALSPLHSIAERAARVTAGDTNLRMGTRDAKDEIASVAEAIDAMLQRLAEAFVAQRRFVHDASHELRTPLTIARGHLEVLLLQEHPPEPEVRETVALAVDELDRMGRVVSSLLRLARIEEERLEHAAPLPVTELVESAVERARSLGDRRFETEIMPEADVEVIGDREALDQVLLNLLSNAVRHTRPGGRIVAGTALHGREVAIYVADDGEGIAPDVLPTLFDRFTRADTARRRDTGGAGLGLAICRAIVEAHDGVIGASSELGHGATFTMLLPIR
jgi:two-component system OmpR family sensor kinase